MLPIIPIPDAPSDYSANYLKISILAWPEDDIISFSPNQFQVVVNQSEKRLLPTAVIKEKSYGRYVYKQLIEQEEISEETSSLLTMKKARVDAATVWPRYTLVFDVRLYDIQEFVLIPGPLYLGDDAYLLPDIEYKRYSHTAYD